jgi:hypothetical protein
MNNEPEYGTTEYAARKLRNMQNVLQPAANFDEAQSTTPTEDGICFLEEESSVNETMIAIYHHHDKRWEGPVLLDQYLESKHNMSGSYSSRPLIPRETLQPIYQAYINTTEAPTAEGFYEHLLKENVRYVIDGRT